jgi:hypothetical protein
VSRGTAEKKEGKNHKKRDCHHHEQRPRKDGSAGEDFLLQYGSSLQRRGGQQGTASGSLSEAAQRLLPKQRK